MKDKIFYFVNGSCRLFFGFIIVFVAFLGNSYATDYLKETVVSYGKQPPDAKIYTLAVDPSDLRRLAYIVEHKNKFFIMLQNQKFPEYDNIGIGFPVFSDAGGKLAYIALKNGRSRVVIGRKEQSFNFDSIDNFVFSASGNRNAYRAQTGNQQCVVIDGKPQKKVLAVIRDSIVFSPDEKHVAYIAYLDKKNVVVVEDNKVYGPFRKVMNLRFSPDSKIFCYKALIQADWFLIVNGKKSKKSFEYIHDVLFSPDSKHIVYSGQVGMKIEVVYDDKSLKLCDGAGQYTFSPDSRQFAYIEKEGEKWKIVRNSKTESDRHDMISPLYFSPNSKKLIYFGIDDNKSTVYINGKKGATYDSVGEVIYSPDSKHYAHRIRQGNVWHILRDGVILKGYPAYPDIEKKSLEASVRKPVFSADSNHLAYAVRKPNGHMMVVEDEVEGKTYIEVNFPVFSPKGHHLAYGARLSVDDWVIVGDGLETKSRFEGFLRVAPLVFLNEKKVVVHSMKIKKVDGGEQIELLRVEAEMP